MELLCLLLEVNNFGFLGVDDEASFLYLVVYLNQLIVFFI